MIAHALSLAARDLLIGLAGLTAISFLLAGLWCSTCLLYQHYAAKHPLPPVDLDRDFEQELAESLRVVGGGSRGPEPRDREAA